MKKSKRTTRIFAILAVITVLISTLVLPIGAEAIPQTFNSNTIYDYPGANLLPYPYSTFSNGSTETINGITYEMQEYGLIVTGGTATAYSYKHLYMDSFPAGTYTISGGNSEIRLIADVYVNGTYLNSAENSSFVVPENASISVYVAINTNKTIDAVIYPMINVGDVAYPYQPYLPYYFQQAFDDGYLNGYDDGYDIGQKDGYDNAISKMEEKSNSIFDTASFKYRIVSNDYETTTNACEFVPNKMYSSISFNNLYNEISKTNPNWDNINCILIDLSWEEQYYFDYHTLQLYISGSSEIQYATITMPDGWMVDIIAPETTDGTKRKLEAQTSTTATIIVKSINIRVSRPADLLTAFTLYTTDESYNNGYIDGYNTGYI